MPGRGYYYILELFFLLPKLLTDIRRQSHSLCIERKVRATCHIILSRWFSPHYFSPTRAKTVKYHAL